ncbi:MAG: hypothetical protein HKN16_08970, partial [Saprospiraceae bacterium]|nr:hypothetical protein [Saprospiraceae bacterium]
MTEQLAKADSLFWAFDLENVRVELDKIDPGSLTMAERDIYYHRLCWLSLEERNNAEADSLFSLSINDQTSPNWNNKLGQRLTSAKMKFRNGNYKIPVFSLLESVETLEIKKEISRKWLLHGYSLLGGAYSEGLQDDLEAFSWYEKEMELHETLGWNNRMVAICYYNLAFCSRELMDYESAITFNQKGLSCLELLEESDKALQGTLESELAFNYGYLSDTLRMTEHINAALRIMRDTEFEMDNLDNIARLLIDQGLPGPLEIILPRLQQNITKDQPFQYARLKQMEARNLEEKGKKEQAYVVQKEVLSFHASLPDFDPFDHSEFLTNQGDMYRNFGDSRLALSSYESSLNYQLGKPFELTEFNIDDFSDNYFLSQGYQFEIGPIASLLQEIDEELDPSKSNLDLAQEYYEIIYSIFDRINKQRNEGMVLRDLENFKKIFGEAVACSHKQIQAGKHEGQVEAAWNFIERGKAILLFESLVLRSIAEQSGLPSELFDQHQTLILEKTTIEEDIPYLQGEDLEELLDEKAQIEDALESLEQRIERLAPGFFERTRNYELASLDDLQNWSKTKQAGVIQYFWSDAGLFGLYIHPSQKPELVHLGETNT